MDNNGFTPVSSELDWDSVIQNDGPDYALLPEGEYPYIVTEFKRSRHAGSSKLPPCNKAILTLEIDGGSKGRTTITHNLFLHTRTEGLLCAFFESIGQRKHGEALNPRWNELVGARGRCVLEVHDYVKQDGTPGQSNQVKKFLPPAETVAPAQSWTPGAF